MPQSIQPVTEAIQRGEKHKAIELIKQALSVDPNDIDMLLVLATLVEEPSRKRQVLNRILSLESTNQAARGMLLEMDRLEMRAVQSPPKPAPEPEPVAPPTPQSPLPAAKPSETVIEKPLVFRYSTVWLVVLYLFTAVFCCGGLLIASQNMASGLPSLGLALLFGLTALSVSSKVEVSGSGVRSSTLLGSTQIKWSEIASLKSNAMKHKLELISGTGRSVSISTQVKDYTRVIEILRQKRPDLFSESRVPSPQVKPSAQGYEESPSTVGDNQPAFTTTRTFRKSFIKQYGLLFALIPMCLLFVWLGLASAETRVAFFVTAGVCALLMLIPFFQVSGIKVEPNKLTIQTFFEEKEFSAGQIQEIKMGSVHGRYGRVTNFVNILPVEGKNYPLNGFSEGDELIYGFLMNWWKGSQNR